MPASLTLLGPVEGGTGGQTFRSGGAAP